MGSALYNIFIMPIELFIELVFSVMNSVFNNPGFAIIFVSIAVQLLCFPLYKRADTIQEQDRQKQKDMEQWLNHIKKTFKGDERFMMQQTYYRLQGYKPIYAVKSSISLLLQIPFFIAAYDFLSDLYALENATFLGIENLSEPDRLIHLGSVSLNLLPILMTTFNIISGIIYTKGFPIKDKIQTYGLACIFLVILYKSPSGLVFYWTLNNLFSLVKNVFMKVIKNPKKVIRIFLLIIGLATPVYVIFFSGRAIYLKATSLVFCLVCISPAVISFIKSKKKTVEKIKKSGINLKQTNTIFYLSITVLCLLMSLIIPVSVIKSSPVEFIGVDYGPYDLIVDCVCTYVGLFFVWINVFYIFGTPETRRKFSCFVSVSAATGIINYLFFRRKLGDMSPYFVFSSYPSYQVVEIIINVVVVLGVIASAVLIYLKKPEIFKKLYQIVIIAFVIMVGFNIFSINKTFASEGHPEKKTYEERTQTDKVENQKILQLSKSGQNVIVFMIDRAIGGYMPYAIEEVPELKEKFDGFKYYENTLSYGTHTNYASPALFGGYEYTPTEINKRTTESLKSKQNEALKVLPKLFSDNGYSVTVCDPPYAGYRSIPDLSIYKDIDNVKAYNTIGVYSKEMQIEYSSLFEGSQERNMFFYSIMKILPVPLQNVLYQGGDYWASYSFNHSLSSFIDSSSFLEKLPQITQIKDDSSNNLLMLQNDTTHYPILFSSPDYDSASDNSPVRLNGITLSDDRYMNFNQYNTQEHYSTFVYTMLTIGDWLDYMRENGVYDNTRIIIVSDHGFLLDQFDYMSLSNGVDVEGYNPVFLVKDFDATGFTVSDEFMTNADTPTLAVSDIIENPVNPYTKKPINNSAKQNGVTITTASKYRISENNGNVFDTSNGDWWLVKNNIFDEKNWTKVEGN